MYICKKHCFAITIFLLILPTLSQSFFQNYWNINEFNSTKTNIDLKINQVLNFTVMSNMHKLIWIEGELELLLTANDSGLIRCEFKDSSNGKHFTQVNRILNLTGNNESQTLQLIFHPHLTTLPGRYNFVLNITGLYNYTENFEIVLGMGYIILTLIILIFGIGLISILMKRKESISVKTATAPPGGSILSELDRIPSRKIQCPECKKLIDEGLAFCPECGVRIPEFLRYNPN